MAEKRKDEVEIHTAAKRKDRDPQGKPYYKRIAPKLYLGYRKNQEGGKWVVRFYVGTGDYKVKTLAGLPDDDSPANGETVLDYAQAVERALDLRKQHERQEQGLDPEDHGPYTVRRAMADYLEWLQEHRKTPQDAAYRINALINPKLGDIECAKLTAKQIRRWHADLSKQPPRARTAKAAKQQNFRPYDPADDEAARRRKSSANRTMVVLKAALTRAWREDLIPSDSAWRRVLPYRDVDAARERSLTIDEAKRLLNACEPDLRYLVHGALSTGARYGELIALSVRDYDQDAKSVYIKAAKTGDGRWVLLNDEGVALFDRMTIGRPKDAAIFVKSNGQRWQRSHQGRPLAAACRAASIEPPITFHSLRHSYCSLALKAGAKLEVVARNVGHSSTRMLDKHYNHIDNKHAAEVIRATAPTFGLLDENNIERLERAAQ